jgi:hypothetical protein
MGLSMRGRRQRPLPFVGGVSRSSGDGTVQAEACTGRVRHRRIPAQAKSGTGIGTPAGEATTEGTSDPAKKNRLGSGLFHRLLPLSLKHGSPAQRAVTTVGCFLGK